MLDHRVPLSTRSLSHAHIRAHHPTMRLERRSSPPCPNADGQTIGTGLPLTLSCGATLPGEILVTLPEATTLEQCANFCGTFHPRCNGINYSEADGCRLIGGVGGAGTARSSLSDDAATAEYPALPPSSCRDGVQMVPGREAFEGMCGQVINDGDLVQRHRETYEACAEDCAGTTDCVAFSFEASMDRGFMNCYLKSAFLDGAMTFVEGVDSGVMSAGVSRSPLCIPPTYLVGLFAKNTRTLPRHQEMAVRRSPAAEASSPLNQTATPNHPAPKPPRSRAFPSRHPHPPRTHHQHSRLS